MGNIQRQGPMRKLNRIDIVIDNLSVSQQLDLWKILFEFAENKLEHDKVMMVYAIPKRQEDEMEVKG